MEVVLNRLLLTKIHMILAAFMFPVALMFLITGGLYTWGITGSQDSVDYPVQLSAPLAKDDAALTKLVREELVRRKIEEPTGKPRVRSIAEGFQLEWTGSKRDVVLEPTSDPLQAKLTVKEASFYRNFVQLHKAKGGVVFKVFAAAFAVAFFLILATGFVMAWTIPKFRRVVNISTLAGVAVFVVAMAAS